MTQIQEENTDADIPPRVCADDRSTPSDSFQFGSQLSSQCDHHWKHIQLVQRYITQKLEKLYQLTALKQVSFHQNWMQLQLWI